MTAKHVTAVLACRLVKGTDLGMLLRLAGRAGKTGRCAPSVRELAEDANLSRAQTQRVLHRLILRGLIDVVANKFGGRPGSTRQYEIRLDRLVIGRTNEAPVFDDTGSSLPAPLLSDSEVLNPNEFNSRPRVLLPVPLRHVEGTKPGKKMIGPELARDFLVPERSSVLSLARQGNGVGLREAERA